MKKFFTLIATALIALGANAQVLINYPASEAGISIAAENGMENTTAKGTVKVGDASLDCILLKNGATTKTDGVVTGINCIKLTTDGGFKAGDIVTLAGVIKTDDETKKNASPKLVKEMDYTKGSSKEVKTYDAFPNISDGGEPKDEAYTLTEDIDVLYIIRNGSTTVNITKILVTRGGSTPGDQPSTPTAAGNWNFSEWTVGTYTENIVRDGLTVTAQPATTGEDGKEQSHNVVIDANNKTVDGVKYTQRLKTGGKGSADSRSLAFNVSGPSTIKAILCSASGSEARQVNIVVKGQVIGTIEAVMGTPVVQTFEYTGEAADIFLEAATSGVNFYAVSATNVTGNAPDIAAELAAEKGETGIHAAQVEASASVKKVATANGIQITKDGNSYNVAGARIK